MLNVRDYEVKSLREKDLYTLDELIDVIRDLECDKNALEEKYNDLVQDVEDNYVRRTISEQVDISDRDFI